MTAPFQLAADTATWIIAISTLAAGSIGLGALGFAIFQIRESRTLQRRQRVYDLQRQYDETVLACIKDVFAIVSQEPTAGKALWSQWLASDPGKIDSVVRVLNFFESVGSEYNVGLLDKKVAHHTLIYLLWRLWPPCRWFVQWIRETGQDERSYVEWEGAYEATRKVYSPPIK